MGNIQKNKALELQDRTEKTSRMWTGYVCECADSLQTPSIFRHRASSI